MQAVESRTIESSDYLLAPYTGQPPPAPAWFDAAMQNQPDRSRFHCKGAEIELLTWGYLGAPGLLFLHGNSAHADWWAHIAPFFSDNWRCAALSFSGMGGSDWRSEGYTLDTFVEEARQAASAAGLLEAPVAPIIVSHSLGGQVAMLAATDSRFRGLIMIDSTIGMSEARLNEVRARAPKPRSEHRAFASLGEALARFRLSPRQLCANAFLVDAVARRSLREHDGLWSLRFDPRRPSLHPRPPEQTLAGVHCPIAYFHGDRSALVGADELRRAIALFPSGTPVIRIADAAHHVLLDQPLALVTGLRTLLATWPR